MAPKTTAERQKAYRERLKNENPDKYEEIRIRHLKKVKENIKKKNEILTEEEKEELRVKWRQANARRAERRRKAHPTTKENNTLEVRKNTKNNIKERLQKLTEENTQLKRRNKNLGRACNRIKKQVEILEKRLLEQAGPNNDAVYIETQPFVDTPVTESNSFLEVTLPNVSMAEKEKSELAIHLPYRNSNEFEDNVKMRKSEHEKRKTDEEPEPDEGDVWTFFVKESSSTAYCALCLHTMAISTTLMRTHLKEEHLKLLGVKEEEIDIEDSTIDEQYSTAVAYIGNEDQTKEEAERRSTTSSTSQIQLKRRITEEDGTEHGDDDDAIESFGRYITSLLKSIPRAECMKLQMDIINQIMAAKLNNGVDVTMVVKNPLATDS